MKTLTRRHKMKLATMHNLATQLVAWHGGQTTGLYAVASSMLTECTAGTLYSPANHLRRAPPRHWRATRHDPPRRLPRSHDSGAPGTVRPAGRSPRKTFPMNTTTPIKTGTHPAGRGAWDVTQFPFGGDFIRPSQDVAVRNVRPAHKDGWQLADCEYPGRKGVRTICSDRISATS